MNKLFFILGNQLFHPEIIKNHGCNEIFMSEDFGLCTYEKHHKLKIYLFLCAMREYKDELVSNGLNVHYYTLNDRKKDQNYLSFFNDFIRSHKVEEINFFEIEDKPFEKDIINGFKSNSTNYKIHSSPMFMFEKDEFRDFNKNNKVYRLSSFYQYGRKKFNILMDENSKPVGGKWSFDAENRKKIPSGTIIPNNPKFQKSKYHHEVVELIEKHFHDHPGQLDDIWFPVTRNDAETYLNTFLEDRFQNFGIYEDAMLE